MDDEHKVWQLHISARETSDSVLTPVIDLAWLPYLELITAHHHALLKDTAPKAFTPKCTSLMLTYGPLRYLWMMRFVTMHQHFKQLIKKPKSFVNVTASPCSRFQRQNCYELAVNALSLSSTITNGAQHVVTVVCLP